MSTAHEAAMKLLRRALALLDSTEIVGTDTLTGDCVCIETPEELRVLVDDMRQFIEDEEASCEGGQ